MMMKKMLGLFVLLTSLFAGEAFADMGLPNLDRTDKTHERRYLDSINVYNRRPIRLNQSGFRPQDYKYAYVADATEKKFYVIDANSGAEAWSGTLTEISYNEPIKDADGKVTGHRPAAIKKPNMYVNGQFMQGDDNKLYEFGVRSDETSATERLYRADFTGLSPSTPGEYFVVVGKDTSATFHIHPSIFNSILENSLKFFGIQRCGNTKSHFHGACHLKDGSAVGHDLTGGWHDCGDHFKVSETLGYTAYVLSMVYLTYQDKAEDRYGNSYADTVFTDGIPDILYEAKIGTDYLLKLYNASKADGLIEKGDMYHSVGVSQADHEYWDLPERQDGQTPAKGGPDRVVLTDIGSNTAGMFIAAMANVAVGYRVYDAEYSDSLIAAAKDIYKNVLMPSFENYIFGGNPGKTTAFPGFYTGGGPLYDDGAAAALALWYATKDTTYQYDLYKNKNIFDNESNYHFNLDYFRAGFLGNPSGFTQGGWATDYQNIHSYVLFAFQKLILSNEATATEYGLSPAERDTLSMRTIATFRKVLDNSTNDGDSLVLENPATQGEPHEGSSKLHVITPYNLVWTSFDWGVMRYNMGTANAIFLMYELTGDERYLRVALDNMYFILGANPWDVSLLIGAGDKNLNHPHNRSANPDGYNAGGMPYEYRAPLGALMGGRDPNKTLSEDGMEWTCTETCIDFTAQFLFPAQSLAQSLPLDVDGPLFSNIAGTPITKTSAIISWDANEVALVTVFYGTSPDASTAKSVEQKKASKGGSVTIEGLVPGETYYFFLEGMDTKRNMTTDDNHGQWYKFTMTTTDTEISGVTICQVDHRSAKIYWWSSDRMNGVVNYGTSLSNLTETQTANGGAVLFHEAELTDLKPGTTYYFNVSSGTKTDNNGGKGYSFTTDAYSSYADLDITIKPSSYQDACTDWKDCKKFYFNISNNDTIPFEDFEVRLYLSSNNLSAICNIAQPYGGNGIVNGNVQITFGTAQSDGLGAYYLPIFVKGLLEVSGRIQFEVIFKNYDPNVKTATFGDLVDSWSLRPHTAADDPEQFKGVDLTKGPYYTGSESKYVETVNGVREVAFVRDPYIAVFYHDRHIYGYTPDYTPENGPQVHRTVDLQFTSPFKSPEYSVEKLEYKTLYEGFSSVSPSGFLDDLEMNGVSQKFSYDKGNRTDSFVFSKDTTLAYGNNYTEWVSWHNHGANKNTENKYDCACAIYRTNVEIDTITTPLESRYLVFDKKEYSAYTGKRAEITVQLLDSTLALIDTVDLTLNIITDKGNVIFWNSATATIPVTSITLVKGVATFYISSEAELEATMVAKTTSSQYNYQSGTAKLVVEKLPDWPIIDVAKMVDLDCDNIPDAINISLTNEYLPNQSFQSVTFDYMGVSYETAKVISLSGKELVVGIDVPKKINTAPSGKIWLNSKVGSAIKSPEDFYQDGISPSVLSVSVLERLPDAKSDKVYIEFSETISAPGEDWPLQLFGTDKSSKVAAPTVKFSKIYNDSLNIWEFEIESDASGNAVVTEGMYAQLMSNSAIKDKNGNGVSALCGQPILPIQLKLIPIPMSFASISDEDNDGLAEHVDITFEREMDSRHMPDSISIIFGTTEPETLWVAGNKLNVGSTATEVSINLATPFSYGITSGTYSGSSKGLAVENAGLVTQHLGSGATYEENSVLGEDRVGPVIASATVKTTKSVDLVLLNLSLSEAVAQTDKALPLYDQKQGDKVTSITTRDVATTTMVGNKQMTIGYNSSSDLAPNDGDFVRLLPKNLGTFIDMQGNMPATNAPWVPISNSGKPKIQFKVNLVDKVTTSDKNVVSAVPSNKNIRLFILNPKTKNLELIQNENVVPMAQAIDSTSLQGAVWKIELTVPRGASGIEAPAWDSLRVRYNMPIYTNIGSYVNRLVGKFNVSSSQYLSSAGKIIFFAEWASMPGTGLQSEDGQSAGTGAYIYKAQLSTTFVPNKDKDPEIVKKFSGKNSYDKTETFGIKRVK